MGFVLFLVYYLVHASASSVAESQENELGQNQSGIHLNIYHVRGHGSTLAPKSPVFLSDVLRRDEERVKALNSRLEKKKSGSHKSGHDLRSKSVGIPLKSGLSIGTGNYYVKVGLGSPAKYYSMVLDTGSSFSWLQCKPCALYCYAQTEPLFDPSASKAYKILSCGTSECSLLKDATLNDPACTSTSNACVYTASYGDASYSIGYLSQDLLTLTPSQTLPRFVYGCGQDNEGLFGRAAGIVGLARNQLSMLAQLSPKYGYAFSYCLPTAAGSASSGGFLSIGKSSLAAGYKFTPLLSDAVNPSLYFLRLVTISVGGRPVGVAAADYRVPTIIDSGTVITRLPASLYTALRQSFVNIMSKKYAQVPGISILDTCFKGSLNSISVPQIRLMFQGGADLTLGSHNILIEADKGTACLAFAGSNRAAIIGNYQQQTFKVAYDVSNSRIGFAAGGCH